METRGYDPAKGFDNALSLWAAQDRLRDLKNTLFWLSRVAAYLNQSERAEMRECRDQLNEILGAVNGTL